jgi:hypothetical protein
MRPVKVTVTGVGVSAPIPFDHYQSPSTAALGATIDSGTATYKVEHTFDDVFAPTFNPATAVWFDHPTLVGKVVNSDSNYAYPPRACRLNVSISSGGNVSLTVNQAGIV